MTAQIFAYDESNIPAVYDRARDHGPAVLDLWMRTVQAMVDDRPIAATILDLGCGTGRFSSGLASHFGCAVLGIDPSGRMLARAMAKPHGSEVTYVAARGEAIPLPDGQCDLVFMSMVFHHFVDPARVARECRRVLRSGGVTFMRAGTIDRAPAYPFVPFFPKSEPLLRQILPTASHIRARFEDAGFRTVIQDLVVQEIAPTHAQYADKLEIGADSVLARMEPADVEEGLARLRAYGREIDPRPVTEPIDCFVFE